MFNFGWRRSLWFWWGFCCQVCVSCKTLSIGRRHQKTLELASADIPYPFYLLRSLNSGLQQFGLKVLIRWWSTKALSFGWEPSKRRFQPWRKQAKSYVTNCSCGEIQRISAVTASASLQEPSAKMRSSWKMQGLTAICLCRKTMSRDVSNHSSSSRFQIVEKSCKNGRNFDQLMVRHDFLVEQAPWTLLELNPLCCPHMGSTEKVLSDASRTIECLVT